MENPAQNRWLQASPIGTRIRPSTLILCFPGWLPPTNTIRFHLQSFLAFRGELESACKWRYGGETDFLLLNYDYIVSERRGEFRFDEVIYVPVETMLKDGRVRSLDALMSEIVKHAKDCQRYFSTLRPLRNLGD